MYGKALEIRPMKAWKLPKGKEHKRKEVCNSGDYFGQVKKDGYWYTFEKDIDGNCFLFSRVISEGTGHLSEKSANVPHIMDFLNKKLPNGTIVIGEIYYPQKGMTSKDVGKIMGCDPEKAVARQEGEYGHLHYYLHDILFFDGKSLLKETNQVRYNTLWNVFNIDCDLFDSEHMELAEAYYDNLDHMIDELIDAGEEGMVLKKKTGLFVPNKKPAWNWIKFKCEDEADVICLGFEPPNKEYKGDEIETWQYWETVMGEPEIFIGNGYLAKTPLIPVSKPYAKGWIGSIKVGVVINTPSRNVVEIGTVSSGLTDELCEEIKLNPEKFIGHPLAVHFMQAYEGALRHPVFERWRDDLNKEDCTWEKIFGEVQHD